MLEESPSRDRDGSFSFDDEKRSPKEIRRKFYISRSPPKQRRSQLDTPSPLSGSPLRRYSPDSPVGKAPPRRSFDSPLGRSPLGRSPLGTSPLQNKSPCFSFENSRATPPSHPGGGAMRRGGHKRREFKFEKLSRRSSDGDKQESRRSDRSRDSYGSRKKDERSSFRSPSPYRSPLTSDSELEIGTCRSVPTIQRSKAIQIPRTSRTDPRSITPERRRPGGRTNQQSRFAVFPSPIATPEVPEVRARRNRLLSYTGRDRISRLVDKGKKMGGVSKQAKNVRFKDWFTKVSSRVAFDTHCKLSDGTTIRRDTFHSEDHLDTYLGLEASPKTARIPVKELLDDIMETRILPSPPKRSSSGFRV